MKFGFLQQVPLGDASVDVAVFCLSLMGTNLADYLTEAHRVLKTGLDNTCKCEIYATMNYIYVLYNL